MLTTLIDENSNFTITIDPGCQISVFPKANFISQPVPIEISGNTYFPIYGLIFRTVRIRGTNYPWQFFTSDISHIILGADFLEHFNIA